MSERAPSTRRSSGGGCVRGCLIALAAVAVLVVGGVAVAALFGRQFVARQLPVWEARQPLLTVALDVTGLRERFTVPDDTERQRQGRKAGVSAKERLPEDLAIYPSPVAETFNVGAFEVTAFQRVAEPLETVRAHLEEAMAAQGWTLGLERQTPLGVLLGWTKDERTCQVELMERDGYAEVWLRSNGKP